MLGCILIIVFVVIILNKDSILKMIYPKKYETEVTIYAEKYQVEENLIYALIKAESNFNEEATSHKGAIGLMQLMEETAVERSNIIDNETVETHDLYDPETNIKLGTSYIAYLLGLYSGNTILALTAYNAGLGNVQQWIKNEIIKPDGSDIENIPYKETENYVRKIIRDYQMYLRLYE